MKIKCTITGQIWDVDHIAASQGIRVATFYSDYELIPDEPTTLQQSPHVEELIASNTRAIGHNTTSIENLNSFGEDILKRVLALESDNQRLKERLNALEGLGIPR